MTATATTTTPPPPRGELRVVVRGIGLLGPGLADWATGRALLGAPAGWQTQPSVLPPPARLPPTERRRAGRLVNACVVVADQACAMAGLEPAALATVFTSSTGDTLNCHLLCAALASAERLVSPTRFMNSVHNAAAGYWHIATRSRQASTSLAAFDASFGAGLLEAAVQCLAAQAPVLLVACDVPYPEPLHALRPLADVFAVALVLAPVVDAGVAGAAPAAQLALRVVPGTEATACVHAGLEQLRRGVPAARALPLLQALALAQAGRAAGDVAGDVAGGAVLLEGPPGMALRIDLGPPAAAAPATLDHAGIAARVPHSGAMCLLERLLEWSPEQITCSAISHTDPAHPLRGPGGLLAANAIEYAAQAMALHASLCGAPGAAPTAGLLASARGVCLHVPRLDTAAGPLRVHATRLAGDERQAKYRFTLHSALGALLVEGRVTVLLDTPPINA